jgi:dipeptidyl aminopeptidase/acylaminoacyl peptidase
MHIIVYMSILKVFISKPYLILLVLFFSCASNIKKYADDSYQVNHEFIKTKFRGKLELLWAHKKINKDMPLIVFINAPFKITNNHAAYTDLINQNLRHWANKGYISAAISLPGHGRSEGMDDFAGHYTQKSLVEVIKYLQNMEFIQKSRTVLVGLEKGAIVTGFISKEVNSRVNILINGVYNFKSFYHRNRRNRTMGKEIQNKVGSSDQSLKERSLMHNVSNVSGATLITHGKTYKYARHEPVVRFYQSLYIKGITAQVEVTNKENIEIFIDKNNGVIK